MTWKTHLIGGATAGVLLASYMNTDAVESALIISSSALGSVLPDIDHQRSKLAQGDAVVGLLSSAVCRFTKHRGFTHTIPGALSFAALAYILMMFSTARDAMIGIMSAFSGFILLQLFGTLRRYSVMLALAAYMAAPRIADYASTKAIDLSFSPETAKICAFGVFAGAASHIVYDIFNKKGAPLLWPIYKKPLHLASIRTRGIGEGIFACIMMCVLAAVIVETTDDLSVLPMLRNLIDGLKMQSLGKLL